MHREGPCGPFVNPMRGDYRLLTSLLADGRLLEEPNWWL
jgi:hypothetical protein